MTNNEFVKLQLGEEEFKYFLKYYREYGRLPKKHIHRILGPQTDLIKKCETCQGTVYILENGGEITDVCVHCWYQNRPVPNTLFKHYNEN